MFEEVSCVIDTRTNKRVSQFYSRVGDSRRKAKSMIWNGKYPWYKAVKFKLENPVDVE
jgi:hypothetical protein